MKAFLIDLDGVLTKDENFTPIDGAVEFIEFLNKRKVPYLIATSNSRFPPEWIIQKLNENGFKINRDRIITPLVVAPQVLKEEGIKSLYIIGSKNLKSYMEEKGFQVKESPEVDAVLVGMDKEIDFNKMKTATTSLKVYNSKLYALNKNLISKDDDGMVFPGVGAVAQMFSTACQCNQDFKHFGKMGKEYNSLAFRMLGVEDPSQVVMISDDIFVDLKGYKSLGLKTVFTTTGKYSRKDGGGKDFIDLTVDSLKELIGRKEFFDTED
ncbi:MAG: HAD hydrolase-like protein [Aquificae bacterium]|nr:HAD hydrolase-like protein [Aquificota bacterium]